MANIIQKQNDMQTAPHNTGSPAQILNSILDGEKMRARFDELLGKRAPQFISSLVTVVNSTPEMKNVVYDDPMSIITAGLRAAMYDLPIDPGLGFAYIIPSKNTVKLSDGTKTKKWQARFQPGYKGLEQLCSRTGVYRCLPNAVDVREGELISYDRLKNKAEFRWIEDEDLRESLPIIGYAASFELLNGAEATVYMSKSKIDKHEKKYRPGDYMSKGWRDDWDAMAKKTVLLELIRKKAPMSIDYQNGSASMALRELTAEDETPLPTPDQEPIPTTGEIVDEDTGEAVPENAEAQDA